MNFSLIAISLLAFAQVPNITSQKNMLKTDGPACQKLLKIVSAGTDGVCNIKNGKFDCSKSEFENFVYTEKIVDLAFACTQEMTKTFVQTLKNQYKEIRCDDLQYAQTDKILHDELTEFCTTTKNNIKKSEELLHSNKSEKSQSKKSRPRRDM